MQNLNTEHTRQQVNALALALFQKDFKDLQETQKSLVVQYYLEKTQRKEVK